jgi:antitoxin VapB
MPSYLAAARVVGEVHTAKSPKLKTSATRVVALIALVAKVLNFGLRDLARNNEGIGKVYMSVYTFAMTSRAKIFMNGGSQAVRLPKEVRFPESQREVLVRRAGRQVILEPADEWPREFANALGAWSEPIERPKKRAISRKRNPLA